MCFASFERLRWLSGDGQTFRIEVIKNEGMEMEFDFVGADAAIANTFRRIMIAEVKQ
jgi:DNA-directed RNA polymerases I and III subunit RPAC1